MGGQTDREDKRTHGQSHFVRSSWAAELYCRGGVGSGGGKMGGGGAEGGHVRSQEASLWFGVEIGTSAVCPVFLWVLTPDTQAEAGTLLYREFQASMQSRSKKTSEQRRAYVTEGFSRRERIMWGENNENLSLELSRDNK